MMQGNCFTAADNLNTDLPMEMIELEPYSNHTRGIIDALSKELPMYFKLFNSTILMQPKVSYTGNIFKII